MALYTLTNRDHKNAYMACIKALMK